MYRNAFLASLGALTSLACGDGGNGPRVDPSIHVFISPGIDSQVVSAGALVTLQPAVRVEDDDQNPIVGRAVHFEVIAGGGVVTDPDVVTGSDGIAIVDDFRLGLAGGRNAVRATVENGPSVTIVAYGVTAGLTAGLAHSCGIAPNGSAQCWGENDQGQLGHGSGADTSKPVQVKTPARFLVLAAGGEHTCGVSRSGAAYCWGANGSGQLGNNSTTSASLPSLVAGNHNFTQITAGLDFTCGLDGGGVVWCWGNNQLGALGDDTGVDRLIPVQVVSNDRFMALAAGSSHVCGIATDGEAHCWGFNEYGGTGNIGAEIQPIPVPAAAGHTFIGIDAGDQHTCAVKSDQTAFCWGLNVSGQLGTGSKGINAGGELARQVFDTTFFLPWVAVAAGTDHTCGLINGGEAYCWRSNFLGALGDNTGVDHLRPSAVAGGLTFSSITSFGFHTCGRRPDGAAFCWGNNGSGQLGNTQTTSSPVPVAVAAPFPFLGRP